MKTLIFLVFTSYAWSQSTNTNTLTIIPKTDLSETGQARWRDKQPAGSNHYVGFKAPDSISANTIWRLPDSDAVGCIQSDGALNLTITTCGAASVVNGFRVTGSSTVGPPTTVTGLQVWYDSTAHSTNILSYDNANALSDIEIKGNNLKLTLSELYPAVGGIHMGDSTHGFQDLFIGQVNMGTALWTNTLPFLPFHMGTNATDGDLYIVDAASNNIVSFRGGATPTVNVLNTLKLGNFTGSTRCLHVNSSGIVGAVSGDCGSDVTNGFIVSGKSTVSPPNTSMGFQVWYETSTHVTELRAYDASNNPAQIDVVASIINPAIGGIHLGDTTHGFADLFAGQINAGTYLFTNTTPFTPFHMGTNAIDGKLYIVDATANNIVDFVGGALPTLGVVHNLKLEPFTGSSRCLHVDTNGFVVPVGTGDCGVDVTNGFVMTGKSTVNPPTSTMGIQMWYETSTHVGEFRVYDASNNPSQLDVVASIINPAVGGIHLGDLTHGFQDLFVGQVNAGTYLFTNTLPFLPFHMGTNATDGDLYVVDSASNNIVSFRGGATPTVNVLNTLKLGAFTGSTRCLHVNTSGIVGTTSGECGGDVTNGFFVTGSSNVGSSTAMGLQVWYDTSTHTTELRSYDAANAPSKIDVVASLINPAVGGIDLGDTTHGFNNVYFGQTTTGTVVFTNTLPFTALHMGTNNIDGKLYVVDAAANNIASFVGGALPTINAIHNLQLGYVTGSTQCLHVNTSGFVSGSGSDCSGSVAQGFFVTGNSAVTPTPTAQGFQASYFSNIADLKVYDNANNPSILRLTDSVIQLAGVPTITATGAGPFTINGSGNFNGDIVLNPANVGATASVLIQAASTSQPGLRILNVGGTTTSDVFQITTSGGSTNVFRVVGATDGTCPNCVFSYSHKPINAGVDGLGDASTRWNVFANALNVGGVSTFNGNLVSTPIGTLSVGSTTNPFGSGFFRTNVSTDKLQVYDSADSDLTLANWSITATASLINHQFFIKDTAGATMLSLSNLFAGSSLDPNGTITGSFYPFVNNTYSLGKTGLAWKDLTIAGAATVGSLTCTGTPCGSGGSNVAQGFFVIGNSNVSPTPTAQGLQESFLSNVAFIKAYDGSSNPVPISITASVIQLANPNPTITATGVGPLTINGSASGNGNILLQPGAIGANASVRVFQTNVGQPALKVINVGSGSASTVFEVDDSNQSTTRFWIESSINSTTATGCANCVHTATVMPAVDATYSLGVDALKYQYVKAYAGQFGLVPTDIPAGATVQMVQNGINIITVDAFGGSGAVPSLVGRSARGLQSSPSSTLSGDVLMSFSGRGYAGGFASTGSAAIAILASENFGSFNQGADMYLQTTANGQAATSRATRAIVTSTGINPPANNTGSLGTSGPCFGGGTSPCSWGSAFITSLTVGSCVGCGGITTVNPTNPIVASIFGTTLNISCPTCAGSILTSNNVWTGTNTFNNQVSLNNVTMTGDITPDSSNTRNLGTIFRPLNTIVTNSLLVNSSFSAGGFNSVSVGSGNFFLRSFFGGASCSGVGDGWIGIDTSVPRIVVCISGVLRSANLL